MTHIIEVMPMPGGVVVQAHHGLAQAEQVLEQVAADEAGHAGDEPGARLLLQGLSDLFVARACVQGRVPGGFGVGQSKTSAWANAGAAASLGASNGPQGSGHAMASVASFQAMARSQSRA